MSKIIDWFKTSNRWKHLVGGIVLGGLSGNTYCAIYVGMTVATVLEVKDKLWGGKWDWIDWVLTVVGTTIGFLLRLLLISLIV